MSGLAGPEWGGADTGLTLATDITAALLGVVFRLASTSAAIGDILETLLSPFGSPSGPVPPARRLLVVDPCARHAGMCCVHRDGRSLLSSTQRGDVVSWLLAELNSSAIDGFDGFAVHAGVLGSGGGAIAFPASSGEGKTTLTAAGLLAGLDYVSDEALCVEFGSREVVAYPRPLAMSSWTRHHVGLDHVGGHELSPDELVVTASELGASVAAPGLHLAHVVRLVRRPGPPALVRASRADAMAWLLGYSFNHYKRPADAFALCAALAGEARAWRLELSDPVEAGALVAARLGTS